MKISTIQKDLMVSKTTGGMGIVARANMENMANAK
jgi:hypothetical protein